MYSKIAIPNMSDFIVTYHEEAYSLVKLKAVDKAVTSRHFLGIPFLAGGWRAGTQKDITVNFEE